MLLGAAAKKEPRFRDSLPGSEMISAVFLSFLKGRAGRFPAVASPAAFDIHMFRMAFVIAVINAFYRLAVDTDRSARMLQSARIRVAAFLRKTFAASIVLFVCVFSADHNIAFAATFFFVINTILYRTV